MIHENELDKLEHLLQSKKFTALTSEEKIWVSQWIESEVEYENLRGSEERIKQHFQSTAAFTPEPEGLTALKAKLQSKHAALPLMWWQVKVPAWSTIIIAIFFGVSSWWMAFSFNKVKLQEQVLTSSIVYDTIYVASKPDTVFIQQVVYKERPVLLTKSVKQVDNNNASPSNGINMKEKEELENLLVSGSR